jgi:hypothetical protein
VSVEVGELDSNPSSEVVLTTPDVPAAPAGLTATAPRSDRVILSWNPVPGALAYLVFMSTSGGPFVGIQTVHSDTTTTEVANLTTGTSYQFEIQVEDANANLGHMSDPVSVTTP